MNRPSHFTFLLLPGFNLQALGAACAVLTEEAGDIPFATAALNGAVVDSSTGVRVSPGLRAETITNDTTLVILSGRDLADDDREAALAVIRRARRNGARLWGIGAGVLLLAGAGLADGTRIAIHPDLARRVRTMASRTEVSHAAFLWSDTLATARAPAAASLMRHALGQVEDVAPRRAETARSQLVPVEDRYDTAHKTVLAGLRIMRANLFRPVSINALATALTVSQRQLERLYERELGDSPAPIYREMRLEAARIEVREGRRPIRDIALDFGVTSASFSKTYLKQFGVAPTSDRRAAIEGEK